MVVPYFFLIAIASFIHRLNLSCSVPMIFASPHPITWFLSTIFSSTYFWWDFTQETPNWQINWQHQKHRQKTVNSLITVMIKATADCRNVHSKCLFWIRIWELSFIMLFYRSWRIYLPILKSVFWFLYISSDVISMHNFQKWCFLIKRFVGSVSD